MKISQISLALFAIALAGCGSNSATTATAPETVGNSSTMMEAPANAVDSNSAMSNTAMSNSATNSMSEMATNSTAMSSDNYRVRGEVVEVMAADNSGTASVMVKHEDIPGFMKAMTMRMPLAVAADASKVKAGDKIVFDMKKGNTEVSNIEMLPASTELKLAE